MNPTPSTPQPAIPNLPDSYCPTCLGDGWIEYVGGPGEFNDFADQWYPSERVDQCPDCAGTGWAV